MCVCVCIIYKGEFNQSWTSPILRKRLEQPLPFAEFYGGSDIITFIEVLTCIYYHHIWHNGREMPTPSRLAERYNWHNKSTILWGEINNKNAPIFSKIATPRPKPPPKLVNPLFWYNAYNTVVNSSPVILSCPVLTGLIVIQYLRCFKFNNYIQLVFWLTRAFN